MRKIEARRSKEKYPYGKQFAPNELSVVFAVRYLISLHYFEFAKDFIFEGERHDFWELLYVDKGEIEVVAAETGFNLKQGDVIFIKPNDFHSVWANRRIAPNAVVVTFVCGSGAMAPFANRIFCLHDHERNLIAELLRNGFAAYEPPFDHPHVHDLKRRPDAPLGAEQLIKIHLELLLLSLAQRDGEPAQGNRLSSKAKERSDDDLLLRTEVHLRDHIGSNLSLAGISGFLHVSQTRLAALFREKTGVSVMKYFKTMKLERAKTLIREETRNFTEIAELLGYSSIHTFSRHFKLAVGMTPSEYARSVQARASDRPPGI